MPLDAADAADAADQVLRRLVSMILASAEIGVEQRAAGRPHIDPSTEPSNSLR